MRNLGYYHGTYVQCDTLMLCDIFKSFQEFAKGQIVCKATFDGSEWDETQKEKYKEKY